MTRIRTLSAHVLAIAGAASASLSLYNHHVYTSEHWTDGGRSAVAYDFSFVFGTLALLLSIPAYLLVVRKTEKHRIEDVALFLSIFAIGIRFLVMA